MQEPTLQYRRGNRLMLGSALPVEAFGRRDYFWQRDSGLHFGYMDIARVDGLACIGTGGGAAYGHLMKRSQEA